MTSFKLIASGHGVEFWYTKAIGKFKLFELIFNDIDRLTKNDENDLPSISRYFIESVKKRISAALRVVDSQGTDAATPYLEWLQSQWLVGRWRNERSTFRPETLKLLDPRLMRYAGIKYQSNNSHVLGEAWIEVVAGYRDLIKAEALTLPTAGDLPRRSLTRTLALDYASAYLSRKGWLCDTSQDKVGQLVTVRIPCDETTFTLQINISFTNGALRDHIDCFVNVIANPDKGVVETGANALVNTPLRDLMPPAAIYYLTHDRDPVRFCGAIYFIATFIEVLSELSASPD